MCSSLVGERYAWEQGTACTSWGYGINEVLQVSLVDYRRQLSMLSVEVSMLSLMKAITISSVETIGDGIEVDSCYDDNL